MVTGSRIASTDLQGPAPVTVLNAEQIKSQGFTTVFELIGSLTQSFPTESPPTWGSTSVNARQADLRGLGSNRTLILVDGHRIDDYPQPAGGSRSFQNLNNIPTGMIDRVEILATGASAIYGSDAISGVINVILKHNFQGYQLDATGGGATRGGRKFGDLNFVGGNSGNNWSIVYNLQKTHRSPLWGRDRPWTEDESDAGYGTWNATARKYGYQVMPGARLTDISGKFITPPNGACAQTAFDNRFRVVNGPNGQYCGQSAFKDWVLTPGRDDTNGYIYGSYQFANNLEAYGSLGVWHTVGTSNTQLPGLYHFDSRIFYDKSTGQVIRSFYRQLTPSELGSYGNTHDQEQNVDFRLGLKGTLGRFDWDASFGRSTYYVHEYYAASNELGMFNLFFGPQQGTMAVNGTDYPVYDSTNFWKATTPAQYAAAAGVTGRNDSNSAMSQGQLTVTGDLINGWAGPIGFAGLVEANRQHWALHPDPRGNDNSFLDPFGDYNTGGGDRNRYSAATEFRIPLLKTLVASVAGRLDHYKSDVGTNTARTWGAKLEFRPVQGLLLRGTYGTNFHAPDMVALYKNPSINVVGIYDDPYKCIIGGTNSTWCKADGRPTLFNVYTAGGPNLLPETGKSYTYGVAWDVPFAKGLTVAADYWRMGIDNAIDNVDWHTIAVDEAGCRTGKAVDGSPYLDHVPGSAYCSQAIANVTRDSKGDIIAVHSGPINRSQLYVSGIDSSINYAKRTDGWGDFKFGLEMTYNLRHYSRTLASDPLIDDSYNNPKTKMRGSVNWKKGPWDATLFGIRYGAIRLDGYGSCEALADGTRPSPGDANCSLITGKTRPWMTFNASVRYAIDEKSSVALTVNNLANRVGNIENYAGGFEFIRTNAGADYIGREIFLNYRVKFN